jgi:hypothetical protein
MKTIRKFASKHTIFFSAVLVIIIMFIYNYGGIFLPYTGDEDNQILFPLLSVFKFFLAFLVMIYLLFFGYAKLNILNFKHTKKSLTIVSPIVAIILIEFIITFIASHKNVTPVRFLLFLFGLLAIGIFEEFLFRVGVLQILLSKWHHSKKELEKSAIVSGIFFGIVHLTNILSGNASLYVLGQCIIAAVIGYVLSIIYIVTKDIWGCVIFHAIFDSVSSFGLIFGQEAVSESISSVQYSLGSSSESMVKTILLVIGFYVIVVLFSGIMMYVGRKLLYMSEELEKKEDKTKTDIFLMNLLKIEEYPK